MKNFIPKDKGDDEAIEVLKTMAWEDIRPFAGELLPWLQDINWPIAGGIRDILLPHINDIQDHIIEVLRGDDGMWKYWILCHLVYPTDKTHISPGLLEEIKRLAEEPTEGDKYLEVDEAAKDVLNEFSA